MGSLVRLMEKSRGLSDASGVLGWMSFGEPMSVERETVRKRKPYTSHKEHMHAVATMKA